MMYQSQASIEMNRVAEHLFSDAHCHLNLFKAPFEIAREAENEGVSLIVTAGGSNKDNYELLKLLQIERVFGVVGISPDFAPDFTSAETIRDIVASNRKIVGLGEIGLDYKIAKNEEDRKLQEKVFAAQLEIAKELNMPVVVHAREALQKAMEMIKDAGVRAMFHFFEGGEEEARLAEKMGYIISVPPVETSRRLRAIRAVGLGSLVIETDSPIVGKTPVDVKISAGIIAKAKGIKVEEVAERTTENLREFFYI